MGVSMLNRDHVLELVHQAFEDQGQRAGASSPREMMLLRKHATLGRLIVHAIVADWFLYTPEEGQLTLAKVLQDYTSQLREVQMALASV